MTASFLIAAALAATCGILTSALYLAWPRRMTAEEWIYHRRAVSAEPSANTPRTLTRLTRLPSWLTLERYQAFLTGLAQDLALLALIRWTSPGSVDGQGLG